MTLTSATPEISIIAMCVAVGATIFAFFAVLLYLWSEPSEADDEAQLYVIHERLAHIADTDPSAERRAA